MKKVSMNQFAMSIEDLLVNPARAHQFSLAMLENISEGEEVIVDPTNPFVFLLEAATASASACLNKTEKHMRTIYPSLAGGYSDIYNHMSDVDYLNRFSTPSRTTITIMLGLDEVKQKAILENDAGVHRLTIPRFTRFAVSDVPFTLLYPIDIRIMRHGGFRITYNDDLLLDVETLDTNLVNWNILTMSGTDWLAIDIPIKQLDVTRVNAQVNRATGFSKTYNLPDGFHYCEAYNRVGNNWEKIKVTHSELVHNPNTPTITLKVLDKAVKVNIPQIYLNNRTISDTVRIDFYTTKGEISLDLAGYGMSSFEAKWNPVANESIDRYSAPLETFNSIALYSGESTTGGKNGISFQELRERVINRTTTTEGLPITNRQLSAKLKDLGFNLVTNIDDITDRQFLATRTLPAPKDGQTVSSMGATVQTLITSLSSLAVNPHVIANNKRTTIKPDILFKLEEGILSPVGDIEHSMLLNAPDKNTVVESLNTHQYLFTPYYYVIDTNESALDARIYDLNSPTVMSRFFFQHNLTIGAKFDIKDYSIVPLKGGNGYYLEIEASLGETLSNVDARDLDIQVSFKPSDGDKRYHIDGTLISPVGEDNLVVGDRYIWRFHIDTRYDINDKDRMLLMPFFVPVDLIHEFDVTTVVKNFVPDSYQVSDLDEIVKDSYLHGGNYIALTQEKVTLKFGERLERLFSRTRTVVDADAILRRESDEPLTYPADVYKYDSTGNIEFAYDPETNNIEVTLLHKAGDIVLTDANQPIYKWRKDDVVLDHLGRPIYKEGGLGLKREIDMFLLDARYQFANSLSSRTYLHNVTRLINQWVNTDMVTLNNQLLERSEMFFYPTITKGTIKVKADNNKLISIDTQQSFVITFFMEETKYEDPVLREAITQSAIRTLNQGLQTATVSKDSLLSSLRATAGNDIVSVDITGFLRDEWRTATLLDPAQRLSIDKRMVLKSNGEFEVEDHVEVKFMLHNTN